MERDDENGVLRGVLLQYMRFPALKSYIGASCTCTLGTQVVSFR